MAELELELELLTKEAAKDLQKFAKSFDKFASGIENKKIEPKFNIADSFKKQFKDAAKASQRFGRSVGGVFDTLKSSIFSVQGLVIGLAGAFAAQKLIGGLKTVTQAAATQEQAVSDLNAALQLAGDFSEAASKDFQDFASSLQANTRVGDETTLQLLALAKSFSVSNEGAKELVSAATDLAQVTGLSLDSAVRNLGKTYGGLTGELGEVIPELKNLTKEQLKSGDAIAFVTKRFGGAAQKATETYGGSIDQLSNSFGDLLEEIGQLVTENPRVLEGIKSLNNVVVNFTTYIDRNSGEIIDFFNEIGDSIVDFAPDAIRGLKSLAKSLIGFGKATLGAAKVASEFFLFLSDAASETAGAFKVLTNPVNSLIIAFNEIKKIKLAAAIEEQADAALLTGKALAKLKRLNDEGKISQESYEKAVQNAAKKTTEYTENIAKLSGEIEILEGISFEAAKNTAEESDKLRAKIQENLVKISEGEKFLVEAELSIDSGVAAVIGGLTKAVERFDPIPSGGPLAASSGPVGPRATPGTGGDFDILGEALIKGLSDSPSIVTEEPGFFDSIKNALGDGAKDLRGGGEDFRKSVFEAGFDLSDNLAAAAIQFAIDLTNIAAGGVGPTQQILDAQTEAAAAGAQATKQIKESIEAASDRSLEIESALANGNLTAEKRLELERQLQSSISDEERARSKLQEEQTKAAERELEFTKQQNELQRQGASELLGAGTKAITDIFVPGAGGAVGAVVTQLSQGGSEAASTFVNGLVDQLPDLIDNLVEATPAIIIAIAERADEIIIALVSAIPAVAVAIAENLDVILAGLGRSIINILGSAGFAIVNGLQQAVIATVDFGPTLKGIGVSIETGIREAFNEAIADVKNGLREFFDTIDPGIGGSTGFGSGGSEIERAVIGSIPGLATGGLVSGTGNRDSEIFSLTPGELVVPDNTVESLQRFLDGQSDGGGGGANPMVALLSQILAAVQQPVTVESTTEINGEALANSILTLNRANARLGT